MRDRPKPEDLRDAFCQAVANFCDWNMGGRAPEISLDRKPWQIDEICEWVLYLFDPKGFRDPMPGNVRDALIREAEHCRGGLEGVGHACEGPKDQSYMSGAQCLLGLYIARVARYERVAKERKAREQS